MLGRRRGRLEKGENATRDVRASLREALSSMALPSSLCKVMDNWSMRVSGRIRDTLKQALQDLLAFSPHQPIAQTFLVHTLKHLSLMCIVLDLRHLVEQDSSV